MRIFLLGDSFTDNTFREWSNQISIGIKSEHVDVGYYVNEILSNGLPSPLHFEDYLNMAGHETINLGMNGCTNDSIFHSFSKIDQEFRTGDRIIINWTGLNRFNWIGKGDSIMSINGWKPEDYDTNPKTKVIYDQYILRMESSKPGGKLLREVGPFMNYLLRKNEEYKPIMWIPGYFPNDFFLDQRFFMYDPMYTGFNELIRDKNRLTIQQEIGIPDFHYGRWGHFYLGIIFNTVLEYTEKIDSDGYWKNNGDLMDLIKENLLDAKPEIREIPGYYLQKFRRLI